MIRKLLLLQIGMVGALMLMGFEARADEDTDGDGVPDGRDLCPTDRGATGALYGDGCPAGDADGDAVPDDFDVCPAERETANGFEDDDGCPDESAAALNSLAQKVFFDTGKASLDGQGRAKVKEVAQYLTTHVDVTSVKVLGYADARGVAEDNLTLSQRRAGMVVETLVGLGVSRGRLAASGEGAQLGDSPAILAANRRADFVVVEIANRRAQAELGEEYAGFVGDWAGADAVDLHVGRKVREVWVTVRPGAPAWLGPSGSRLRAYAVRRVGQRLAIHCRGVDVEVSLAVTRAAGHARGVLRGARGPVRETVAWSPQFSCSEGEVASGGVCRSAASLPGEAPAAPRAAGAASPEANCYGEDGRTCFAVAQTFAKASPAAAAYWYRQACTSGDPRGCDELGRMCESGEGVARDLARAAALFLQACSAANGSGCLHLGRLHAAGSGVAADPAKAAELYEQACKVGVADGCTALALCCAGGVGLAKDEPRAVGLFRQACGSGSMEACAQLGIFLCAGRGVPRDATEGEKLLRQVCADRGFPRGEGCPLNIQALCEAPPEAPRALSGAASLAEAMAKMKALDGQLVALRAALRQDLAQQVLAILSSRSATLAEAPIVKDEFETAAEFDARKAQALGAASVQQKFASANRAVLQAWAQQSAPLLAQMQAIREVRHELSGPDDLVVTLGTYQAETETFLITITSKAFARHAYPWSRFLFVSDKGYNCPLQPGDMLVSYNDQPLRPTTDMDALRQTVLTDTTALVIERAGNLMVLQVPKEFTCPTKANDYASLLPPGIVYMNFAVRVPREKAKLFKQNLMNGQVKATLVASAVSADLAMPQAVSLEDLTDHTRYDDSASEFVNLGHNMTFVAATRLVWLTEPLATRAWVGAVGLAAGWSLRGLSGWRLPEAAELQALRSTAAISYVDGAEYYHTRTKNGDNHVQFRPSDGSTDLGDSESEAILVVLRQPGRAADYDLLAERFLPLTDQLVYDTARTLVWIPRRLAQHTWLEAEKFVSEFTVATPTGKLGGWRLPTVAEFKSLYDPAMDGLPPAVRGLADEVCYSSTIDRDAHVQIRPSDQSTDLGDNEQESVTVVQ